MEGEFLPPEENFQAMIELSPEDLTEDLCWQEETDGLGSDPAVPARRKAPGRHDAVDVGMEAPTPTIP
jgi:hypothetical protein